MSLQRMIVLSVLLGGWGALLGWAVAEFLVSHTGNSFAAQVVGQALFFAPAGAGIGAALGLVSSLLSGHGLTASMRRVGFGALGGFLGGFLGGALGQLVYGYLTANSIVRAFGWALMGLGIGIADGLYERSPVKLRNGLVGGALGGFLGGLLFDPISRTLGAAGTGMTSRVVGLVIVGCCIAGFISLVQVVLRQAWLTQLDGFRTGRQIILTKPVSVLGRAEHVAVPFLGSWGKPLELEHARILKLPDGRHEIEDNNTVAGTRINNQPLVGRRRLQDGDTIVVGSNYLRFHEKAKREAEAVLPSVSLPPPVQSTLPSIASSPPSVPPAPVANRPSMPPLPTAAAPISRPPVPLPAQAKPGPVTPAKQTGTSPVADICPGCKRKLPGKVGTRYCMVCDITV